MAARVTGDTSDDTHLADDSKRRENAAGCSGYAPPVQEECRMTEDTSVDAHHASDSILLSQFVLATVHLQWRFHPTVPRSDVVSYPGA